MKRFKNAQVGGITHSVRFRFIAEGKPWFEMIETVVRTFKHAEVCPDETDSI